MIRLYVPQPLTTGLALELTSQQIHYLLHVMRVKDGQQVLVFNGHDGEWKTEVSNLSKRSCLLSVKEQTQPQQKEDELWLLFATLKPKPQEFLIEKATEVGATHLCPILTERSSVSRFNVEKATQQAIEAAEQSGRTTIPQVFPLQLMQEMLANRSTFGPLIVGDETHKSPPLILLGDKNAKAFMVGPEGGWSPKELEFFRNSEDIYTADLMSNILRAETAGIIGLATLQQIRKYK